MLDFLKEYDISDVTIKEIEKQNYQANIYNLSCNKEEIIKMLNFFRKLNINCINDLLIYRTEIFFNSYEDIVKVFSKHDIKELVEKINDDFTTIDEIN